MNKIEICRISIPICLVFVTLLINSSYAQSDNFKTYTNKEMKFSIQYPSNWQVEEKEEYPNSVTFQIPDRAASFFMVSVGEPEPHLDTDTMTLKNNTLEQEVKKGIDTDISIFKSKLLKQNKVIIGGNTGIKTELIDHFSGYKFYITTIANGKIYQLSYIENPLKVPETLPLVNKMVESFQVIK
jgi:PsbP-like protein